MYRYVLTAKEKDLKLQEIAVGNISQITKPLLVSGFNGQLSDSSLLCSPSLQLNADLSSLSPIQLTKIAIAEREKLLSSQLKSYIYKVEARAAVIASDSELLADFLDIYSGLLETVPILFSPKSREEYIPAEDLQLQAMDNGSYLIRYSSRVPIDRQKCIWCRACIGEGKRGDFYALLYWIEGNTWFQFTPAGIEILSAGLKPFRTATSAQTAEFDMLKNGVDLSDFRGSFYVFTGFATENDLSDLVYNYYQLSFQ